MKEAIVTGFEDDSLEVQILESQIPKPNSTQVLIKVMVSGSNPKDW